VTSRAAEKLASSYFLKIPTLARWISWQRSDHYQGLLRGFAGSVRHAPDFGVAITHC